MAAESANDLDLACLAVVDQLLDLSELGLEVALVAHKANLARLVPCGDDLVGILDGGDHRLFDGRVLTCFKRIDDLRDVLRVRRHDHYGIYI